MPTQQDKRPLAVVYSDDWTGPRNGDHPMPLSALPDSRLSCRIELEPYG